MDFRLIYTDNTSWYKVYNICDDCCDHLTSTPK